MKLLQSQIQEYNTNGYLLVENVFSKKSVQTALEEMQRVITVDCENRILEKTGAVRSFFSPESFSEYFAGLVRHENLVVPSMQLIGTDVYVHQTKLNSKFAMVGDWWEWHQDYTFWKNDDGMETPNVLTAMIFLNDVTEFNGPMLLIPGSHAVGTIDEEENAVRDEESWYAEYNKSTTYMSALTSDLKYTLKQDTVRRWAKAKGLRSAKGPAGSVLFFHGNVFHASSNNMSPWDRHSFLVTYNSLENKLPSIPNPRPAFIANRVFEKVLPLPGEVIYE